MLIKGSLLALAAFFFMALFGVLTKLSLQTSSFVWTSFLAYLTGSILLLPAMAHEGKEALKSDHYGLLFSRALFGTCASFLYTVSIHYIPIVNSTLLFNTAPIFIPLLSMIFLKASIDKRIWMAVAIGFLGIVIIIKPTAALFTQAGNLIGLVSGLFLAIAYLSMKLLTKTDPGIRIIFYYLAIGALIQAPLLLWFDAPDALGALYAALSGCALLTAQLALARAYLYAEASEVGIYQYASVVFVGLIEWIFWNQVPTSWDVCGIVLVSIAGMLIIRNGRSHATG